MNVKRLTIATGLGLGLALALLWTLGSVIPVSAVEPVTNLTQKPIERPQRDATPIHYVAITGADSGDCSTPAGACRTIQYAVDLAGAGDEVRVATGVYTGVLGRAAPPGYDGPAVVTQVVYISKTVALRGGYTTTDWNTSDPISYPTTLDAGEQGRVLFIAGEVSPTVEGLRVTGGDAGVDSNNRGGGLYVLNAEATIRNNWVFGNAAQWGGGGLHLGSSAATISGNAIYANSGNGLHLSESAATVSDNRIYANEDLVGGGVWLVNSDATLRNNHILSNTAYEDGGGLCLSGGRATLEGNVIAGNSADVSYEGEGGGLYLNGDDAVLISNTISGNSATYSGGGVFLYNSAATLDDNAVFSNTSKYGAGINLLFSDQAVLESNRFVSNTAQYNGGGIHLTMSDATLDGNFVAYNAANLGGGLYLSKCAPRLQNNIVVDNQADTTGDGMYIRGVTLQLLHNTLARNGGGSGLYVTEDYGDPSVVDLVNTILVSHTVGITVTAGNTATLEATLWGNDVEWSGDGTIVTGTHNVWGDPAFVDPDGGDYHILAGSVAIGAGVNTDLHHDVDGQPRPMDWDYDLGADEYPGAGLVIVKQPSEGLVNRSKALTYTIAITSAGSQPTTDVILTDTLHGWQRPVTVTASLGACALKDGAWGGTVVCQPGTLNVGTGVRVTLTVEISADATLGGVMTNTIVATADETWNKSQTTHTIQDCYARVNDGAEEYYTVQQAVDAASPGDLVKVAGYCIGVSKRQGSQQQVYVDKNLTIRGGYAPTDWDTFDPTTNPTTLDANGQGRVLYITGETSPTIEGLHITGGDAAGLGGGPPWCEDAGGGVYANWATATVSNTHISGNTAECGGGMHITSSSIEFGKNKVFSNTVSERGGGLYVSFSTVSLNTNVVSSNTAGVFGGGIYFYRNDDAILYENTIASNTADTFGGGVYLGYSAITLDSNTIISNTATSHGGGLYLDSSSDADLSNNVIAVNEAAYQGGGLALIGNSATLSGNTISDNNARDGGGIYLSGSEATLDGNFILSNSADEGGGVRLSDSSDALLLNNVIADNRADVAGSGVYVWASSPRLVHNTLARNDGGSGVCVVDDGGSYSAVAFTNTILVSHTVGISVAAGNNATLAATLWGTGAWSNGTDWDGAGAVLTGTINLWGDPAFLNPAAGDYHLAAGSAAIDAGIDAGVDTDVDGDFRPLGMGSDVGADEFLPGPMLAVAKGVDPPFVRAGERLTYTLRVTNTGNVDLHVTITDTLPQHVTQGQTSGGTLLLPGELVTWTAFIPAPGGIWSETLVVTVAADYAGPLTNVVGVGSDEGATGRYTHTLAPGLALAKQAVPDPVQAGGRLTYTLALTNSGDFYLHPTVTDLLPAQVTPNDPLTWTVGSLAPGDVWSETVVVTVAADYAGPLSNVVQADTVEGMTAIYTTTSQVEDTPALQLVKRAVPDPVGAGQRLTYTLRVSNTGNVDLHATITDALPAQVMPGGVLTWTALVPVSGTWSETLVVTVAAGYSGTLSNRVSVNTVEGAAGVYTATSRALFTSNQPPHEPSNPNPLDGATGVPLSVTLRWQGGDPDGDPLTYTVAFGSDDPPPVLTQVLTTSYDPGPLGAGTTYYWRITASDGLSSRVGPLWHFATLGLEKNLVYLPLVLKGRP